MINKILKGIKQVIREIQCPRHRWRATDTFRHLPKMDDWIERKYRCRNCNKKEWRVE